MLSENLTSKEISFLIRELLSSIKDINMRLSELSIVFEEIKFNEDSLKMLAERVSRLKNTRMCLMHSLHDIRKQSSVDFDKIIDSENFYKELKRA